MASSKTINMYKGLERRSSSDRRLHNDRRNLVRFESLGSDRRMGLSRREEEFFVKTCVDMNVGYLGSF
jgi:hypothetical protein